MRIVTLSLLLCSLLMVAATPAAADPARYEIRLLAEQWTPSAGLTEVETRALAQYTARRSADGHQRVHVLMQLHAVPNHAERQALRHAGIQLGPYVDGNAWIASLPVGAATTLLARPEVRWATPWDATRKLHPRILAGDWAPWTRDPLHPELVMTFVQLHHDVDPAVGVDLAARHGGTALATIVGLHGMTVWMPEGRIMALAQEEDVLWVSEGPPPLSPNNDGARAAMDVDPLTTVPYSLDGDGVRLFVFDAGTVRSTHTTFDPGSGSRVTVIDAQGAANHPTHVGGTAAGDGNDGRPRGVAPGASVLSAGYSVTGGTTFFWDDLGDLEADYATGRNSHDADLVNNSIGSNTANNGFPCDRVGDYGMTSSLLDGIIRGDNAMVGSPMIVAWSSGNERTGGSPRGRCGSNFFTHAPPACAKNPIHVGAANSDGGSMTSFSSWGPCDDGRMKPTITGPGCESGRVTGENFIFSSLNGSNNQFGGSGWCGTSMSSPAVAGVIALMIEDWRAAGHGGAFDRPMPALVRALLAHTARDRGQDGPDYIYGYGMVDAKALIDHLRAGDGVLGTDLAANWGTGSLAQGDTNSFTLTVPAEQSALTVTLAWDDAAAVAFAANAPVNDLTLELLAPGGAVHEAWVLDPANPHQPATRGANGRDNIEQVRVENPAAGTWTVRVVGTAVPVGPQAYGLAHNLTENVGTCTTTTWDFEDDNDLFMLSGATRAAAPAAGHGSFSLQFGGGNGQAHEAFREITVPTGDRIELSLWWHMTTDHGPGFGFDNLLVEIRSTADAPLALVDWRSDGWPQDTWLQQQNVDLTPWSGQTIRIALRGTTNGSLATTFWVDDVQIEACTNTLFFSGFETGDTSEWTVTVN